MLVAIGDRIPHQRLHVFRGRKDVVEARARRFQRMAAAQRGFDEILRPDAFLVCLPEVLAAIGLQPLDAGLAAAPALDHALHRLETVEVVAVDAAVADADRLANAAPSGISIDGVRHVTGRLDPAMNGNLMLASVSYISFAQSQFHDRCLSLNTGTERPLSAKTLTICLKNS